MTKTMVAFTFSFMALSLIAYGEDAVSGQATQVPDASRAERVAAVKDKLSPIPSGSTDDATARKPKTTPQAMPSLQEVPTDLSKGLEMYWSPEGVEEANQPNVMKLDVDQSVQMALEQNPQVLIAQDDIDSATAQIDQAKSKQRPEVTADVSFTRIEPKGDSGSLGSIMGGGGALGGLANNGIVKIAGGVLQPGGVDVSDVVEGGMSLLTPKSNMLKTDKDWRRDHVAVSQVLYAGGQIKAAISASKYLAQSKEWRKQAVLNDLEYQVKSAYYNALLTRALIRVAEESVVTFERHLADTKQMLEVGLVSNFELLRAQTEVGARQSDLVTAKNAQRLALANLRRILGVAQDTPILLTGDLDLRPVEEAPEVLIQNAVEARPELTALDKAMAAAGQNVTRAKGQFKPKAVANAEYVNMDGGSVLSQEGWTFSGAVQWDVYAGGRRKADVAQAKADRNNLEHQKVDVTRLVQLDVQQAYIQMQDALAKIHEDRGTVDLARESRRLAELRFQEGVGTQVETLDAELALTRAETKLVQDFRDYATARAALDKAVGRAAKVATQEENGAATDKSTEQK